MVRARMDKAMHPRGPDSVLTGLDGFLFERLHNAMEQARGDVTLSDAQVKRWVSLVETRDAWCRQRGMRHLLLIAPAKHVVYSDKVPGGLTISHERPIGRILQGLSPDLRARVVYPDLALLDGRREAETYFATDTHWNDFAAYLVYRQLHAALAFPPETLLAQAALERSSFRHMGDLGVRLTPEQAETASRLVPPEGDVPAQRVFSKMSYTWGQIEVFERNAPADPHMVFFRDSAGSYLLPFLKRHCRRLVAVASKTMFYDLLRIERPDIVLTEISEVALCLSAPDDPATLMFPDDFPPYDFTGFTGVALPLVATMPAGGGGKSIVDLDFGTGAGPNWSTDETTEIVLKCRVPYTPCLLSLTVSAFVHPPVVTEQRLEVQVNGRVVGTFALRGEAETLTCALPLDCLVSPRTLRIDLFHPDCVSPQALGIGSEERAIAIKVHRLVVAPAA